MLAFLEELVIRRTHRVPVPPGPAGDGATVARQFDAVLMQVGFKLSGELLTHLSRLDAGVVMDIALRVLPVVRQDVGDHVEHNLYFKNFPNGVPDTLAFWARCLTETLLDPALAGDAGTVPSTGLNLVDLPSYGRYLHTYEEMLDAHQALIPAAGDRITLLHLGEDADTEVSRLYFALAGATVPLNGTDLEALTELAAICASGPQPDRITIRENRAVINQARLRAGQALLIDTVTDVLRLACALSGGDVTLASPTKFGSFPRSTRRALLAPLDGLIAASPGKLGDVAAHGEAWKRLGERLHPGEYPQWPNAQKAFDVARGELTVPSLGGRVNAAVTSGDVTAATRLLQAAPGLLVRRADLLLRTAESGADQKAVVDALARGIGTVSGRVVLQLREHLLNRGTAGTGKRIFPNRSGTAWVTTDSRAPLDGRLLADLFCLLDEQIAGRLPAAGRVVLDEASAGVALPLTGKAAADGFAIQPRGSVSPVTGELLRFFIYWKEREQRTDFDLSAALLDEAYRELDQLSYTNISTEGGEHSGDITSAPDGASEFINLDLTRIAARHIVPQVHVFSGEGFLEVEESFFGFMLREAEQQGLPFEPTTVRARSDLRGVGRVALPLAFSKDDLGVWKATWLHLFLHGAPAFNQLETHRVTSTLLVRQILERRHLDLRYLTGLMAARGATVTSLSEGLPAEPLTYLGLTRPDGLAPGSTVYTLDNLFDLIPA